MRIVVPAADLFDAPPLPPGLEYHADFLAANEETALLRAFADLPFREAKFQQYTARRRVDRYGLLYDAEMRDVDRRSCRCRPFSPICASASRRGGACRRSASFTRS